MAKTDPTKRRFLGCPYSFLSIHVTVGFIRCNFCNMDGEMVVMPLNRHASSKCGYGSMYWLIWYVYVDL